MPRLELASLQGSFHDHINDCRRQPLDFNDIGAKLLVQCRFKSVENFIFLGLRQRPAVYKFLGKQLDNLCIAVLRRSHRFHNIAGVLRMVVAVIRNKLSFVLVRCEESSLALVDRHRVEISIAVLRQAIRLEKLTPFVELERARFLLLVNYIRRSSGRNADGACRKLVHLARVLKFTGLGDVIQPFENDRFDRVEFVRNGLRGVHALDKIYSFLKGLLDFLVI